jgi:serine/threonine protein phosphatase PrpC
MFIQAFGHTDIGKERVQNEDSYLCLQISSTPSVHLAAVADGMGGHSGGEIASSLAIEALKKRAFSALPGQHSSEEMRSFLEDSFQEANREIFDMASREERLVGMGTTLVGSLLFEGKAHVANIGDSRAYHFKDRILTQITRDHTWKADQIRLNSISEEEIYESPFKNMVTRSLGFDSEVMVDIFDVDVGDNEYLLLCSDGLYNPLSSEKIGKIFIRHKTPKKICLKLVQSACQKGGQDNITAVVIQARKVSPAEREKYSVKDTVKLDPDQYKPKKRTGPNVWKQILYDPE